MKAGRWSCWGTVNRWVAIILLVTGAVYVGNTWSPSSYGHVLVDILGYSNGGPDWGQPQRVRSDEWADVTPLTQATVNNQFERYNQISLYGEDLRMNYGLPLRDWGLIFKPTMWLYGWVNPAYAYSFHWFSLSVLFLVGYAWLFRWLGASPIVGFALAGGLYFTGFVQFWWNEKGSEFALFPWIILSLVSRLPLWGKILLFYWAAVAWLLTNFYPPIQISLAFVGLVLLLAFEPGLFKWRSMSLIVLAAIAAAGTVGIYLWDYLQATATTIYPGQRRVSGGGSLLAPYWMASILPTINLGRGCGLPGYDPSVCEMGTFGMHYWLLAVVFLDISRWRNIWTSVTRRRAVLIVAFSLVMVMAWMILPLPAWAGSLFLWDRVPTERMQYAFGLLCTVLLFLLVAFLGLRFSWPRLIGFSSAVLLLWWVLKYRAGYSRYEDLVVIACLLPAFMLARCKPGSEHATLAIISMLTGVLSFGGFNPLQPAWPIFNRPPNEMTKALDSLAASNGGTLAIEGLPSAVANGLGYRSLSHVTVVPQLSFWRMQYPDMAETAFNSVFNRFSHIVASESDAPRLLVDHAIAIPVEKFQQAGMPAWHVAMPEKTYPTAGHIDSVVIDNGRLVISGWAPWSGPVEGRALEVATFPKTSGPLLHMVRIREDLPQATGHKVSALNGFTLVVPWIASEPIKSLCVLAYDTSTGQRAMLAATSSSPTCQVGIENSG